MKNLEDLAKFPSENPNPVLRMMEEKIIYTNKAGEELFNINEGSEVPTVLKESVIKSLNTNEIITTEIAISSHIFSLDIIPISEEGYVNVYGKNITDKKEADILILESEKKLKDLIEALPIGISMSNAGGMVFEINSHVVKIFGYNSKKDFLDVPAKNHYYNPADRDTFVKMLERGFVKNFEVKFKRKDGTLFWGSVTSIIEEIGNQTIYINTFQDISVRKKVEEEVADLAKFPEENPNPVLRVSKDFVLYTNQAGQDLFNVKIGSRIPILLQNIIYKTFEENMIQNLDITLNDHFYSLFVTPIEGTNYANIYGLNITERKKAEKTISDLAKFPSENPNPIIRATKEVILYSNKAGMDLFNIKKGDKVPLLLQSDVEQAIDSITNISLEVELKEKIYSFNIVSIKEEGYVNIYGMDITDRKKAEEALREREKYKFIFDSLIDGVLIIDKEWRYLMMNDLSANMTQMPKDELIGRKMTDVFPGVEDTVFGMNYARVLETGEPSNAFDKFEYPDGRVVWYETQVFPIPEGLLIIVVDITERKKAEVEIANLAKFPSENPNPILRTTKELVIYSNQAGKNLFNCKEGDKVPQILQLEVKQAIDSDTNISTEVKLKEKTYSFNIVSIKAEGYVNIYGRDITDRKCAEIDLQKSEATYREAYNRAEFYKDIFTHDINNILQNISNGIQLNEMYLNNPDKSKAIKRNIDIIKRQVKRGANLVSNVRKLSKISESENLLLIVNANDVLTKTINYINNAFQDKNLKIEVQISEDNYEILANELLEDVFENILTNSINYNDSEGITIEVKVSKELRQGINYIKFQVSDNGIGITDERKQQIFIRGFSEKTSVHGMGLGLSLVKKIIDSYRGEIWMEDRVKGDYTKGSRCFILIPEVVNNG